MSTTNCNTYVSCETNSSKSNDQIQREAWRTTENGCPALAVTVVGEAADPEDIQNLRLQIEGDATAFSEQPAELLAWRIKNTSGSDVFVKIANETDLNTTPGTTPVEWEMQVPANGFVWQENNGSVQHYFSTAITVWATTDGTDTGAQTAPTVDTVTVQLYWRN